jgi:hypothetical protein
MKKAGDRRQEAGGRIRNSSSSLLPSALCPLPPPAIDVGLIATLFGWLCFFHAMQATQDQYFQPSDFRRTIGKELHNPIIVGANITNRDAAKARTLEIQLLY